MPNMINLESTGLRRSTRLDNKPRQKYGLFYKFSLEVIVACDVAKNYNIFLTRANQPIHEIIIHFDRNLNHYGPMVFAANQEKNE